MTKYLGRSGRIRCCAVLFACAISRVASGQDIAGTEIIVRIGPAGVHLDPNSASVLVGTLAVGARVPVSESRNGWYRVRLPKAESDRAAIYGWIPAEMVATAALAPVVAEQPPPPAQDGSMYGVLRDLKGQRDRLDRAIQILDSGPDADALRARRGKIDVAINALESGSDMPATEPLPSPRTVTSPKPSDAARPWDTRPLAGPQAQQFPRTRPATFYRSPRFSVGGEYSFLNDQTVETNAHGWLTTFVGNLNDRVAIAGELGGNYKTYTLLGTDVLNLNIYSFLAGPRFSGPATSKVTPFGQVLLGGARASAGSFGDNASITRFAVQPGGGVDVWLTGNVGVRIGGDYRRVFFEDQGGNEFRFHVGILVGGGQR